MSDYDFDTLQTLKPGDVIFECEMGMNIKARVLNTPLLDAEGYEGKRRLTWAAENTEDGSPISYMVTEGLMHYGPHLYREPQYGRLVDGVWTTKLVGEKP